MKGTITSPLSNMNSPKGLMQSPSKVTLVSESYHNPANAFKSPLSRRSTAGGGGKKTTMNSPTGMNSTAAFKLSQELKHLS